MLLMLKHKKKSKNVRKRAFISDDVSRQGKASPLHSFAPCTPSPSAQPANAPAEGELNGLLQ